MKNIEILCNSNHGVFIPQLMGIRLLENGWQGIDKEDLEELEDPENECYWEVWEQVLNNAYYIDEDDIKWDLHQDGDLFAIAYNNMSDDDKINFFGEL